MLITFNKRQINIILNDRVAYDHYSWRIDDYRSFALHVCPNKFSLHFHSGFIVHWSRPYRNNEDYLYNHWCAERNFSRSDGHSYKLNEKGTTPHAFIVYGFIESLTCIKPLWRSSYDTGCRRRRMLRKTRQYWLTIQLKCNAYGFKIGTADGI